MDNCNSKGNVTVTLPYETLHYKEGHFPTFFQLLRLGNERFSWPHGPQTPLSEFGLHRVPNATENPLEATNPERVGDSRPYVLSLCELPLHSHYFALVTEALYDDENPESDLLISRSLCLKVCDKLRPVGGGAE
jgi:hypothetical protein